MRTSPASSASMPKLIAFDLDGTIWTPDMYQLWGGGAPFTVVDNRKLRDSRGETVRLLGISDEILHELKYSHAHVVTAWVSCTDEPLWAEECLRLFRTPAGESLGACVNGAPQIFQANKQEHFLRLQRQYPHIAFADMMFFDNEVRNIRSVSQLGVFCVHCPAGMSQDVWFTALEEYKKRKKPSN